MNSNLVVFMLDIFSSFFKFFAPDRIVDDSSKTTDIKLATGIITGLILIAIAYATLTNLGQSFIE